jgi:hypothetical protein
MPGFLSFVAVVICVLQVILFFKIWNACDNVKRLTDHFVGEDGVEEANFNNRIAAGDDSVESSIRKELARDIEKLCKQSEGATEDDFARIVGKTPEEAISELKAKYKGLFGKLNKPVPTELSKLKTIEDLWNLNSN